MIATKRTVVLLTGAGGFIGRHLAHALEQAGHAVVRVRSDFTRDVEPEHWRPRLEGVDVVINAVGILRERGGQTFLRIHELAPRALFDAAAQCGVKLVIQISALGADEHGVSAYHRSKKAADDHLVALGIPGYVLQPSLVYGPGGTSARMFETLAAGPMIVVPGRGAQRVQPVFIDDLTEVVCAMVARASEATVTAPAQRVAVVGPEPITLRAFLERLRRAVGLPPALVLRMPMSLVRLAARIGDISRHGLLDSETLAMLERGNTADVAATREWLGHAPRAVEQFVDRDHVEEARTHAVLGWWLPLLRISVALVWIVTGAISFGLYPIDESYALLARVGVTGAIAPLMLYGAALLDVLLGVAVLVFRRRWVWVVQVAVMVGYTLIISLRLPEFWLHPYGPLLKNIPLLAVIGLLYAMESRR